VSCYDRFITEACVNSKLTKVYVVTGLKIAKGLRYSKQRASENKASVKAGGHVTQDATLEGYMEDERGTENTGQCPLEVLIGAISLTYHLRTL
jgi:hypothetical protein